MQAISAKSVVNLAMCDMDILSLLSLLKQILLSCGQDLVNRLLNMGQILTNILIFLFNVISFLAATSWLVPDLSQIRFPVVYLKSSQSSHQ